MADTITVRIQNCNSIDLAEVSIIKGSLNIKYGPNGIGKSTIAKAIVGEIRKDGSLESLIPFKHRASNGPKQPSVTGANDIPSALVFDEDYVTQFAFKQDEVIKNSFDIFIKTPDYISAMEEIDSLLEGVKRTFADNTEIASTLQDLRDLRDAFGSSKTGTIPKNSKIHKAYGTGNKIENVPESLKPFELFIKGSEPSKWISWQIKGNDFLKLGDICPYCSTDLPEEAPQKQTALSVAKEYDATAVGHLNTLKAIIERLGKYFSDKCADNLVKVTTTKTDLTSQEQGFLSGLKTDIESLIEKLESLREISFFSLRDVEELDKKVERLKIDLSLMDKLDSVASKEVVNPINEQLDSLLSKIGPLKGSINKQKAKIEKTIKDNQDSINAFLKSAGYKYSVAITPESHSYKMKLIHQDMPEHIELAAKHLSYGEKNAFALVLFMHQVLSERPVLVVLDDPISSFDKNKKFAILHELFQGKASLKGCTTLMLTHDIEPAIDAIKATERVFKGSSPNATFLTSKSGVVSELGISKADIQTFAKICKENIAGLTDTVIKSIYLRRHYEIVDDKGNEYELLANLFHKRPNPIIKTANTDRAMTAEEIAAAQTKIREDIPEFDYNSLITDVTDETSMRNKFAATTVGYEKIQLFRIIRDQHEDDVITKFINESYHIENEYVMQLNPHRFESVPEYVVEECTRILAIAP